MKNRLSYFQDSGTDRKKYALILAAYYDRNETAKKLIETDPEQINRQDPHSGLTTLHIAIFRQNVELVEILTKQPRSDITLKDVFQRRAVDMLDYTSNQQIFELVTDATYPDLARNLKSGDEGAKCRLSRRGRSFDVEKASQLILYELDLRKPDTLPPSK